MKHIPKRSSAVLLMCAIFLSISVFLSCGRSAFAAEDAQRLVTVGIFSGNGYAEKDTDGRWSGIDIEITENIAQTAGLRISFVEETSVKQAFRDLDDGQIDMLADIAKTPVREEKYLFSEYEQGSVGTNVFVQEDDNRWDYENTDQLKKMIFSCERDNIAGSDFRAWCKQYGFTPNIVLADSGDEAVEAVKNGEADGYIDGENFVDGFRSVLSFSPSPYYYVFAKTNRQLKLKVDAALGQIYIQDPLYEKELMEKYIGLTQNRTASFSEEEKKYVAKSSAIRIAVLSGDKPYFSGTADSPKGILPELYKQIASVTGLSFDYQVYDNQPDAIAAVENGDADLIGLYSGGLTQAFNEDLIVSRKYMTVSTVMITSAGTDSDHVHTIAVKDRSKVPVSQNLPDNLAEAQLISYDTAQRCFQALTRKQADAVIVGLPSATYLVNQRKSSSYTITPVSSVNLDLCAAAAQKSHTLITILNKGINSVSYMSDGIVANNTAAENTISTAINRIPASVIVIFASVMILLVVMLLWAVASLSKSRKTKVAAVEAEAEASAQRIKAEASEKNAAEKNAFFANISHDMRTPLNAIVGFIHLAKKEGISDQERNEYLDKADRSSALLLDLVNDTLTLSKAQNGKLQLHLEPVDNRELLEAVIVPIREAASKKHIKFEADLTQVRRRTILADKLNIQKLLLNLLSNAVKYTPDGGNVSFHIYLDPAGKSAPDSVFTVSDDGIGMTKEFLPKIFEPFTQEKRDGYASVGTGLGLSIVKQLVELMGGSIRVESKENKGTTITVRLHFEETAQAALQKTGQRHAGADLAGKRVLLCEDNPLNREIATALLSDRKIAVVAAENGRQGVQIFSESDERSFDAVLMDVRMPVMDGIEATRAIRCLTRSDAKTVPVIAMTADAFDDDIHRCLEAGMDGHIAKPIDPEILYEVLTEAVGKREVKTFTGSCRS